MSVPQRIIRSPAELKSLSALPLMQPRPRGLVRLESGVLSESQRTEWEQKLNGAYNACGCGEAAAGTLTGLLLAGAWIAIVGVGDPGFDWADGGVLFLGLVIGTSLGKFLGLLRAQARLQRSIIEIGSQWSLSDKDA